MAAPWEVVVADRPGWPDGSADLRAAVEGARAALARLNGPRGVRDRSGRVAAAALMRAARASAALAGAPLGLDPSTGSIVDPVLAGAVRAAAALADLSGTWRRAPRQVLARLHTLAAADLVGSDGLGRPRVDPGDAGAVSARLAGLADVVVRAPWPAPVMVAIVHGELATLEPFGSADGVVARAAARLSMVATGLDPAGWSVPEVAHLRSPERYRTGLAGYAQGGTDGVEAWVIQVCEALDRGATEGAGLARASS
jgi:hypothetical protein